MSSRELELIAPMIALVADMGAPHLARLVQVLIERADDLNLRRILESGVITPEAPDTLRHALAGVESGMGEVFSALARDWRAAAGTADRASLSARLFEIAGKWQVPQPHGGTELSLLLRLGADPEAPVGGAGRTAIGQALSEDRLDNLEVLLRALPGDGAVLPRASARHDVLGHLVTYRLHDHRTPQALDMLLRLYPDQREHVVETLSRAVATSITRRNNRGDPQHMLPPGHLDESGPCGPGNALEYLARGLLNDKALNALWATRIWHSMRPYPFFSYLAAATRDRPELAASIGAFARAGVNLGARFDEIDFQFSWGTATNPRVDNVSCLEIAAREGHVALVQALLDSGAVPERDFRDLCASTHADGFRDPAVEVLLRSYAARRAMLAAAAVPTP